MNGYTSFSPINTKYATRLGRRFGVIFDHLSQQFTFQFD